MTSVVINNIASESLISLPSHPNRADRIHSDSVSLLWCRSDKQLGFQSALKLIFGSVIYSMRFSFTARFRC